MVNRKLDSRGASRLGCLFTLLVLAAATYFGLPVGRSYFNYFRVVDAMKQEARAAVNVDNATIKRRMRALIADLGLPEEANNFQVRRTSRPREVVITTNWSVVWEVPYYTYTKTFTPEVRFPL